MHFFIHYLLDNWLTRAIFLSIEKLLDMIFYHAKLYMSFECGDFLHILSTRAGCKA